MYIVFIKNLAIMLSEYMNSEFRKNLKELALFQSNILYMTVTVVLRI
jgi:hypothetical protein